MANDQKPANLATGSIVVAGLAVAGSFFIAHEAPLQGSRPVISEPPFHQSATSQDIDARLWQDPFAAVARTIQAAAPDKSERCELNSDSANPAQLPSHCNSPLAEIDPATLVVAVTIPGGPYGEDSEVRRRSRYAVLSGLERAGFVPEDEHHIGYFRPHDPTVHLPELVPYERFARPSADQHQTHSVLVLWINEDALRGKPLQKLASLVAIPRQEKSDSRSDVPIRIVGPYSSGILLDMAKEVDDLAKEGRPGPQPCRPLQNPPAEGWKDHLKSLSFYEYGATVDDKELFKQVQHCDTPQDSSVHDFFKNRGITLYRTIATDDVLAHSIVEELKLRVEPGKVEKSSLEGENHVALISEWDTFYGQTLPHTMEDCFEDPDYCLQKKDSLRRWVVHRLTYMRGLDGQLPGTQGTEDRKTGKGTEEADKQARVTDFFKTKSDVNGGDRPNGQGQLDYLRRLADHLRKIDDDLRRHKGRIRAIGILGSDVFDKLLVLRALKPKFPEALFFTTDFDAALTMWNELDWTRNLIISSSFGPELRQEIQGEIPPFRSGYQTAAFLAASLAIGDPANNWCAKVGQEHLSRWLSRARIVEIERTGDVLPFPAITLTPETMPQPEACLEPEPGDNFQHVAASLPLQTGRSVSGLCTDKDLSSCNDIQPPEEKLFPEPRDPADLKSFAGTLAGAALLVLLTLFIRQVRRRAGVEVGLVGLILLGGAFACYFWAWIAKTLTEHGEGEPIALLQGVSVWPTVLLRALSIILAAYLFWRAWRKLDANLYEIARDMKLPMPELAINAERAADTERRWRKKLVRMFSYSLRERQADGRLPDDINTAWSEYVYQGRWVARLFRVAIYTAAWFTLVLYVVVPMLGHSIPPTRGLHTLDALKYTSRLDWICQNALMFLVFDATLLCLLFVKELRRGSRQWPDETRRVYETRLGLADQFVDEWIDLDFVAKRTHCISALVYYPFILIALLILSRSTVFADYPPSVPMLVIQGISLTIVFGCAIVLCWAAQAARGTAKQRLTDGIICAKGPCAKDLDDGGCHAGQLEILLVRVDDLRDGAFSPLSQQPFARALLLPLGSFGWTTLLQNGMLPGL